MAMNYILKAWVVVLEKEKVCDHLHSKAAES